MMPTLVIADDEAPLRQLLRILVARAGGIDVVGEAADGFEAVTLVEDRDPDVLLLDLGLPVMDGLEVLERLRGRDRPRVVVLTGFADDDTQGQALHLGAAACLVKGRDFDRLPAVISGRDPG